jgi:hypothetical protein
MATGMERDHVRDARTPCGEHREWADECVVSVHMYKVPTSAGDLRVDARCEVVVPFGRPRPDPPHIHAVQMLARGKFTTGISRQNGHPDTAPRQPTRYLIDMKLNTSHERQIPGRRHQEPKPFGI